MLMQQYRTMRNIFYYVQDICSREVIITAALKMLSSRTIILRLKLRAV